LNVDLSISSKNLIMNATTTKRQYNTVLSQAKKGVPGFALAFHSLLGVQS
jgi:hypothetical protein